MLVPEQPIPEQDPVVTKSYAAHYVVAMVILMATLFWALWDEAFGQRPWKAFQNEWKTRYTAFLNNATSKSAASEKDVEKSPEYQQLKRPTKKASDDSAKPTPRRARRSRSTTLSAQIAGGAERLHRPARLRQRARPTRSRPRPAPPARRASRRTSTTYKSELATVEFPDGSRKKYNFPQLEETYNELNATSGPS